MGAAFGCFVTRDADAAAEEMWSRTRSDSAASLLDKLQRSFSSAWLAHVDDSELSRAGTDSRDHEADDWMSWDAFLTTNSSAAASSGSRMLSEVYSQALELGGNSFFLDARGERIRGAYLDQIEVVDEYFGVDVTKRERRRLLLARGSTASVEDDADFDADDCCASTMDLDTDLDMERFLTQSSPPLSLLARDYGWPHSSNALGSYKHDSEAYGMASEPLHRGLLPMHSLSMSAMPAAAPPRSWACPTGASAWQPAKQRALASYYINRLPRGSIGSAGSLALSGIAPSVAS